MNEIGIYFEVREKGKSREKDNKLFAQYPFYLLHVLR
jgi:hypothetical protein